MRRSNFLTVLQRVLIVILAVVFFWAVMAADFAYSFLPFLPLGLRDLIEFTVFEHPVRFFWSSALVLTTLGFMGHILFEGDVRWFSGQLLLTWAFPLFKIEFDRWNDIVSFLVGLPLYLIPAYLGFFVTAHAAHLVSRGRRQPQRLPD